MGVPHLDSFVSVPLPIDLYAEISRRYPAGVSSVLESVVWDFLERTENDFNPGLRQASIYWDSLPLPEGTEIRTKYFNEYKVAAIQSGEIVWEGESYPSMSQLARAMRGDTSNNAWKVLEIKRPSDTKWQIADFLRK